MSTSKRDAVLQQIIEVAWADGTYDEREKRLMDEIMDALGTVSIPDSDGGSSHSALAEVLGSADERAYVFQQAAKMSYADGVLTGGERLILDRLSEALGLEPREAAELEAGAREIMSAED